MQNISLAQEHLKAVGN